MTTPEITLKPLPSLRLAARTARAGSQPEVGPLVGPMFDQVADALAPNDGLLETPVAQYAMDGDGVTIVVGYAYDGEPRDGFEIVELAGAEQAACTVHHGSMAGIGAAWAALHAAIEARGLVPSAPCREVYVVAEGDDQSDWVTELQQPVAPA